MGALRGTQSKAPPPARRRGEHGGGDACASARPARGPASSRGGSSQQNYPYLGPLHRRGRGPGISQVPRRSIMIRAGVRARLRDAPDGLFHKHGNRPVEACRYGGPTLLGGATLNQHGAGPRLRAWDPCPSSPSAVSPDNGEAPEPRGGSSTDPPPGGTSDPRSAVCHPRWPHPPGRCHLNQVSMGQDPGSAPGAPAPPAPSPCLQTTGKRQNFEQQRWIASSECCSLGWCCSFCVM